MTFGSHRALVAIVFAMNIIPLFQHCSAGEAPRVLWEARVVNCSDFTSVSHIACDFEGNSYLYGPIRGDAAINGTSVAEGTNGQPNLLAKFTPAGQLDWAVRLAPGLVSGLTATATNGEVMLFGDYWNEATIGSNVISDRVLGTTVMAKFSSGGSAVWFHKFEERIGSFGVVRVALDSKGFLHTCLAAVNKISFGTNIISGFNPDESYIVVALLHPDGQMAWALPIRGIRGKDVSDFSTDLLGNTYITGRFTESVAIGDARLTSRGKSDAFIAKLDPAGSVLWAKSFGGVGSDEIQAVAVDADLNCYISGAFSEAVVFGRTRLVSEGGHDIFLSKLNEAGEVSWVRAYGTQSFEGVTGLAVDNRGTCWMSGYFSHSLPGFGLTNGTVFVSRFDEHGSPTWSQSLGREGEDKRRRLAMDGSGNIVFIGGLGGSRKDQTNSVTLATKLGRK